MATAPLKALLEKAHVGKLGLPEFQRDFVWKPSQVVKLVTSIMNGYPIGGLLFMEDENLYEFRCLDGAGKAKADSTDHTLVLDGQQRLTSCYQAFFGAMTAESNPGRYYFKYQQYLDNPDVSGSDVENLIEYWRKKKVEKELATADHERAHGLFPLDIIFSSLGTSYKWLSDFSYSAAKSDKAEFERLSVLQAKFIQNFIERITGYQIQFEEIQKGTSPDVICTVFETINTTGKKLTVFDLLVARCYKDKLYLREFLKNALANNQLIREFDPEGEELCTVALPRIIGLLSKGSCKRGDLLSLDAATIGKFWERAVEGMEAALKALVQRFGAFSVRSIPQLDMISPMAVILTHPKFKQAGRKGDALLAKWYWRSVFSQYFVTSGETKAARAVKEWGVGIPTEKGWLDDDTLAPESVKNFELQKHLLQGVSRQDDTIYRGVMCLLFAREIRDLKPPQPILARELIAMIDDHHIFPQKFLALHGIKGEDANQIANRTPIHRETNRKISAYSPNQYMNDAELMGTAGLPPELLARHLIPTWLMTEATFSRKLYDRFIEERQAALMKEIERLVEAAPVDDEK